jgi:hypothetical protein
VSTFSSWPTCGVRLTPATRETYFAWHRTTIFRGYDAQHSARHQYLISNWHRGVWMVTAHLHDGRCGYRLAVRVAAYLHACDHWRVGP